MSKQSKAARAYCAVAESVNRGPSDEQRRRVAERQAELNQMAALLHAGKYADVKAVAA